MQWRAYDPQRDRDAILRLWKEIGWSEEERAAPNVDIHVGKARAIVADLEEAPECLAASQLGDMDYLAERLKLSVITAVATSLVARRRGLASRLTAARAALDVADGAAVCVLGVFDQGFYDKLGFGTGSYEHTVRCSPAALNVDRRPSVPRRLSAADWQAMHTSRVDRLRVHGSCVLPPQATEADVAAKKGGFGFGYFDEQGKLTHHLWLDASNKAHGPYRVQWMAYQDLDQLLELLALLRSLGDQVQWIEMREPPNVQMQDFIERPFYLYGLTRDAPHTSRIKAYAYWQARICDLPACLAATHLAGKPLEFNLELDDPIASYLDEGMPWRGISGQYVVTMGPESRAEQGADKRLPSLQASVGAFTRLWLGVLPATSLAVSDSLGGPHDLLQQLDVLLRLPTPRPDWDF